MNWWSFLWRSRNESSSQNNDDLLSLTLSWSEGLGAKGFKLHARLGISEIGWADGKYREGYPFHLTRIEVSDRHRGNGYGTIMIFSLIGVAKAKKCTKFVFEGVSDKNEGAIRLYTKHKAIAVVPKLCADKTDYEIKL